MSAPTFPVRIRTQFEIEQIKVAYDIAQEMATDMPPSQLQFMADVFSGVAEANDDDHARAMAQAFLDTLETIMPPSQLQFMADVFSGVAEANDDDHARAMAQAFLDTLETIIG